MRPVGPRGNVRAVLEGAGEVRSVVGRIFFCASAVVGGLVGLGHDCPPMWPGGTRSAKLSWKSWRVRRVRFSARP